MTTLLGKSVNQLSGGEAQRVALARAVLTNPRVILMDEPLASLDAKGKMEILNEIKRLSGFGVPIVYVTHSMEELLLLADRVLILNEGRNTFYGELPDAINHIFARHPEGVPPVSVLHMKVEGYDEPYSLQSVCSEEDVIYFTCSEPMADSSPVRVIVHGKDVVLFKNRPEGASALNMLRATISSVQSYDTGQVFVSLTTSAGDLRTLVTKKSYDHLQLSVGDSIWAVTKAVSILV
jgi:molybdate transport system ATP-binding protein